MKKVAKKAVRESYLSSQDIELAFEGLAIKVEKAKRTYLDIAEIKKWKAVHFNEGLLHLERDRDLFLFQIYTGYYYGDLLVFTMDYLQSDEEFGNVIVGARDKNGNQTINPLFKFPHAEYILRKYGSSNAQNSVIDAKFIIEEPVYNRHFEEIAKMAGINKNVPNKVARHTNGQLWIRFGAEGAILSKMMGHTKQETTKSYYDINLPEIVEGTKRADFEVLGI